MRIAFIIDPLPSLKAYKDSSVAMMRAAQAAGAYSPTIRFKARVRSLVRFGPCRERLGARLYSLAGELGMAIAESMAAPTRAPSCGATLLRLLST